MILTDFRLIRPPYETSQEEVLEWFVDAHAKSESYQNTDSSFREAIKEKFWRVGCKPNHIAKRGHVLEDYRHRDWDKMSVYRLNEGPIGKNLSTRAKVYDEVVDTIFNQYYPDSSSPPDDLIHVSCTGYVAPSGAQKIVSKHNWGHATTVTHAYHMGCYGSMPAIRMGTSFLNSSPDKNRTDIVHTEICSLHTNPSMHQLDQLVSQSLFADGFMKYSVVKKTDKTHLKIHTIREEIIPDSTHAMTWNVMDWGFQMTLAKEVPVFITRHLPQYLERLCKSKIENAIFAVHPGGPKILSYIQKLLNLTDSQMQYSVQILKEYGNMSSATLPHIWQRVLEDAAVPNGTPIISLAFGPGLSICGAVMEKICGS